LSKIIKAEEICWERIRFLCIPRTEENGIQKIRCILLMLSGVTFFESPYVKNLASAETPPPNH